MTYNISSNSLFVVSGGMTLYGMCNTGMYFMSSKHAKNLITIARAYLDKAMGMSEYTHTIPYAPSYFGVDSVILWAAQYYLNYTVDIVAPRLNYMAPVEGYMKKFIDREKKLILHEFNEKRWNEIAHDEISSRNTINDVHEIPRETEMSMNGEVQEFMYDFLDHNNETNDEIQLLLAEVDRPLLVHFSKGSELIIEYRTRTPPNDSSDVSVVPDNHIPTLSHNETETDVHPEGNTTNATTLSNHSSSQVCVVVMRGHLKEDGQIVGQVGNSRLLPLVYDLIDNETTCHVYADALLPFRQGMGEVVT